MNSSQNTQKGEILIAGKDYPRTYREFVTMFFDDESYREFLYKLRWNGNFICPKCKVSSTPWHQTHKRLVCPNCRHQTTVTVGTIFDKTRTPLNIIKQKLQPILNDLFNEGLETNDRKNRTVPHTLRHTFASHLAINGNSILKIQKLMNHKTIEMTMRYSKLSPESGKEEVRGLKYRL